MARRRDRGPTTYEKRAVKCRNLASPLATLPLLELRLAAASVCGAAEEDALSHAADFGGHGLPSRSSAVSPFPPPPLPPSSFSEPIPQPPSSLLPTVPGLACASFSLVRRSRRARRLIGSAGRKRERKLCGACSSSSIGPRRRRRLFTRTHKQHTRWVGAGGARASGAFFLKPVSA